MSFANVADLEASWACSDPPLNKSCWSTNRPVSYSAGLYDLQYRLYIGLAYWPTGQLAIQQAAGV